MTKLVISICYGGFSVSEEAIELYKDRTGRLPRSEWDFKRDDPELIRIVKELGERANGSCAQLKVVEIPDDVEWVICQYDGLEWVAEDHRTWR